VVLFAENRAVLDTFINQSLRAISQDGLIWISYLKKNSKMKSGLSGDIFWELMMGVGMRLVHQISMVETWSALRFRPEELVGKK